MIHRLVSEHAKRYARLFILRTDPRSVGLAGYASEIDPWAIDSRRFEVLDRARVALGRKEPERAAADLRTALALGAERRWRIIVWMSSPSARSRAWRSCACRRFEERLAADLAEGRDADLVGELQALVAAHPFRERMRGQLMLALGCGPVVA